MNLKNSKYSQITELKPDRLQVRRVTKQQHKKWKYRVVKRVFAIMQIATDNHKTKHANGTSDWSREPNNKYKSPQKTNDSNSSNWSPKFELGQGFKQKQQKPYKQSEMQSRKCQ